VIVSVYVRVQESEHSWVGHAFHHEHQVRSAMSNADTVQLLELGAGLLEQLSCEANTTAAMQVFDFASRQPDLRSLYNSIELLNCTIQALSGRCPSDAQSAWAGVATTWAVPQCQVS